MHELKLASSCRQFVHWFTARVLPSCLEFFGASCFCTARKGHAAASRGGAPMPITRSYANKARQSDKASGPRHHIRRFWQLARGTRSRDRERRQEAARLEQPLHRLAPDHARQRDELVHKLGCWGFWGAWRLILTADHLLLCTADEAVEERCLVAWRQGSEWSTVFVCLSDGCLKIWEGKEAHGDGHPPAHVFSMEDCSVKLQAQSEQGWGLRLQLMDAVTTLDLACSDERHQKMLVDAIRKHCELLRRRLTGNPGDAPEVVDAILCHQIESVRPFSRDFWELRGEHGGSTDKLFVEPIGFAKEALRNYKNEDDMHAWVVETSATGLNGGRKYCFRVHSAEQSNKWRTALEVARRDAKKRYDQKHFWERVQLKGRATMQVSAVQGVFTTFVLLSWAEAIADAELRPQEGEVSYDALQMISFCCTIGFTVELCLNLACYWFWDFFTNGWQVFDMIIVLIALAGLLFESAASHGIKQLRVLRVLRVLRAVGKFKELRKIINGILASIFPMCHALFIALLVLSIFTTVATELFAEKAPVAFGVFSRYGLFCFLIAGVIGCKQARAHLAALSALRR